MRLALALVATIAATEPEIEYGTLDELRGAQSFYVAAGVNLRQRAKLIAGVKAETKILVADRASSADVIIVYEGDEAGECGEAVATKSTAEGNTRVLGKWKGCPKTPFLDAGAVAGRWFGKAHAAANR